VEPPPSKTTRQRDSKCEDLIIDSDTLKKTLEKKKAEYAPVEATLGLDTPRQSEVDTAGPGFAVSTPCQENKDAENIMTGAVQVVESSLDDVRKVMGALQDQEAAVAQIRVDLNKKREAAMSDAGKAAKTALKVELLQDVKKSFDTLKYQLVEEIRHMLDSICNTACEHARAINELEAGRSQMIQRVEVAEQGFVASGASAVGEHAKAIVALETQNSELLRRVQAAEQGLTKTARAVFQDPDMVIGLAESETESNELSSVQPFNSRLDKSGNDLLQRVNFAESELGKFPEQSGPDHAAAMQRLESVSMELLRRLEGNQTLSDTANVHAHGLETTEPLSVGRGDQPHGSSKPETLSGLASDRDRGVGYLSSAATRDTSLRRLMRETAPGSPLTPHTRSFDDAGFPMRHGLDCSPRRSRSVLDGTAPTPRRGVSPYGSIPATELLHTQSSWSPCPRKVTKDVASTPVGLGVQVAFMPAAVSPAGSPRNALLVKRQVSDASIRSASPSSAARVYMHAGLLTTTLR